MLILLCIITPYTPHCINYFSPTLFFPLISSQKFPSTVQLLSCGSPNVLPSSLLDEILLMLCFGTSFVRKRCLAWDNFKRHPLQVKNSPGMTVLEILSPASREGKKQFCRDDRTGRKTLISINQRGFAEDKVVIFHLRSWPSVLSAAVLEWHQTLTPGIQEPPLQ